MGNAKIQKFKCDILANFQTMWFLAIFKNCKIFLTKISVDFMTVVPPRLDEDISLWHTFILHQNLTGSYFLLLIKCFLLACKFWPKKKLIPGARIAMPIRKLETQVLSFLMSFHLSRRKVTYANALYFDKSGHLLTYFTVLENHRIVIERNHFFGFGETQTQT